MQKARHFCSKRNHSTADLGLMIFIEQTIKNIGICFITCVAPVGRVIRYKNQTSNKTKQGPRLQSKNCFFIHFWGLDSYTIITKKYSELDALAYGIILTNLLKYLVNKYLGGSQEIRL